MTENRLSPEQVRDDIDRIQEAYKEEYKKTVPEFPEDHWIHEEGMLLLPWGYYTATIYQNERGVHRILLSQDKIGLEIFSPETTKEQIVWWTKGYEYGRDEVKGQAVMKLKEVINHLLNK